MGAAVHERLRRNTSFKLHPELQHALLIYEESGIVAFKDIYHKYIDTIKTILNKIAH